MKHALRHPALQSATGVGALFALTWPLLVFDRPVYVVCAFFTIWAAMIGLLFLLSSAAGAAAELDGEGNRESESPDDRSD